MAIEAGSVVVSVIPSARGWARTLNAEIKAEMKGVIDKVTVKVVADMTGFKEQTEKITRNPLKVKAELDQGSFQRDVRGKLEAAIKSLPKEIGLNADATDAEREVAALRTQLETLSKEKIGVTISGEQALTEMEYIRTELERLSSESPNVQVTVDAGRAAAELAAVEAQIDKIDGRKATANVGVDNKGVNFAFRGVSALTTAIIGMGPAAVVAGAVAAGGIAVVGSALTASLGAVGIWGGVMAGALSNYKKDVTNLKSLGKQLQSATDPAKIKKIKQSMKDITDSWSPAEKTFDKLKEKFTNAFKALTKASGPATFGVLNAGMTVLMGIMPKLTPIIDAVGGALTDLIGDFGKFAKSKSFQDILDWFRIYGVGAVRSFAHIAGNVLLGIINIFKAFAPYQSQLLNFFEDASGKFLKWSQGLGGSNGLTKFMDYIKGVLPDVKDLFSNLFEFIGKFVTALGPLGGIELKGLTKFLEFLNTLPPKVLTAIAFGITAIALALKALQIGVGIKGVVKEFKSFKDGIKALNVVMKGSLGPWSLVILGIAALAAGLIYAYKHSRTFHHIVVEAWRKVKEAISVAWNRVIKPALDAFVRWIKKDAIPWINRLWKKVIQPTFRAIGTAISWAWTHVIKPAFKAWWTYITKVLIPIIKWLWKHVVAPAFSAIGTIIKFTWNHVVKPVFDAIKWTIKHVLAPVIVWLWKKVVAPAFSAIGSIIKFAWNHVVKPIFDTIKWTIKHVLAPVITWLWKHVVRPGFEGIGTVIKNAWTKVISPAFGKLKTGLGKVKDAFHDVVTWVKNKWGDLSDLAKKPVRFIVNTIIRDGILAGIRKIPGLGGVGKGFKGVNFAKGGVMPGYTPGKDVHHFYSPTAGNLHLSGGEAIMRPEWTRAVGGEKAVERMNKNAARGRFPQEGEHFAKGGVFKNPSGRTTVDGRAVSRIAAAQLRLAQQVSHLNFHVMQGGFGGSHIAASGSSHNYPGVVDVGPGSKRLEKILRQVGFAAWARNIAGRSHVGSGAHVHAVSLLDPIDAMSPQVYGSWQRHGNGLSGSNNDPAPHYAWLPNLKKRLGATNLQTGNLGGYSGVGRERVRKFPDFKNPLPHLFSMIKSWKYKLSHMGGFGDALTAFPKKALSLINSPGALVKKAIHKGLTAMKWIGSKALGLLGAESTNAPHQLKSLAMTYLRARNWQNQWPALNALVNSESTWRPTAQNKHSTAYGLFQFLNSTWASVGARKSSDPNVQMAAGMKYIAQRYGDPNKAWAYHKKHGTYDDGGLAAGKGLLVKDVIKPERVLSPRQTENHERLTAVLDQLSKGKSSGRTELVITNWKTGQGYIRHLASDEVASASEFAATRRRM